MTTIGTRPNRAARLGVATIAAAALLLGACTEEERLSDLVEQTGSKLVALSGGGVAPLPPEYREREYNSIVNTLQTALRDSDGEPGEGAAKLMLAQAMLGQAGLAAERVGQAHSDILFQVTEASSRLDLHADRIAFAESLEVYDPSSDLTRLDESQAEIERDLGEESAELADRQNRIIELRRQMDEQRTEAERYMSEANRLRADASGTDAIQRAQVITEVNQVERSAARHEKRFAELQLLAKSLEDEAKMIRIRIASHQRRDELVREARARVEASANLLEEESNAAKTDARDLASELGGIFDQLMETLDERVGPSFDEAVSKYSAAVSQAQQARREVGNVASSVASTAQHASANLHHANAEVIESLAALAERLGRSLAAARFQEKGEALRERYDSLNEEAIGLYESAAGSSNIGDQLTRFAAGLRGDSGGDSGEDTEFDDSDSDGSGFEEEGVEDDDTIEPAADAG